MVTIVESVSLAYALPVKGRQLPREASILTSFQSSHQILEQSKWWKF